MELTDEDRVQLNSIIERKIADMLTGTTQYPQGDQSSKAHVAHIVAKLKGELDEAEPPPPDE